MWFSNCADAVRFFFRWIDSLSFIFRKFSAIIQYNRFDKVLGNYIDGSKDWHQISQQKHHNYLIFFFSNVFYFQKYDAYFLINNLKANQRKSSTLIFGKKRSDDFLFSSQLPIYPCFFQKLNLVFFCFAHADYFCPCNTCFAVCVMSLSFSFGFSFNALCQSTAIPFFGVMETLSFGNAVSPPSSTSYG